MTRNPAAEVDVMQITVAITREGREDLVVITRADGEVDRFRFPAKGPLPHDGVHHVVESVMELREAFWGRIAAGQSPEDIQRIAHAGGHASAKRAIRPAVAIIEMIQAERLVECLEADAWGGEQGDFTTFREVYAAACAQGCVDPLPLDADVLARLRRGMAILARQWADGAYRFDFPVRARSFR